MSVFNLLTIQCKGVVIGIQLQNQRLQLRYGIILTLCHVGQILRFANINSKFRGVGNLSIRVFDIQLVFSKLRRHRNGLFVACRLCHGRAFREIFGSRRRQPNLVVRLQQASAVQGIAGRQTHVGSQLIIRIRHNGFVNQVSILILQAGIENHVVASLRPDAFSAYVLIQRTVGGCGLGFAGVREAVGYHQVVLSAPVVHLVNVAESISDNVTVKQDIGASLVRMEAVDPATLVDPVGSLAVNVDVVSIKFGILRIIRAAGGAVALLTQRIDTAAVLQDRGVILDAVVIYMVISGGGGGQSRKLRIASNLAVKVTPAPANAHGTVGALINKVMLDPHVLGEISGDRGTAREEIAVLQEIVVSDIDILGNRFCSILELLLVRAGVVGTGSAYPMLLSIILINMLRMADGNTAATGMTDIVAGNLDVIDIVFSMEAEITGHLNLAVQNGDVVGRGRMNGRRGNVIGTVHIVVPVSGAELVHVGTALYGCVTVRTVYFRQVPVGIGEG